MSHKENAELSQNISEEFSQDMSRKKKKQARAVLSFVVMAVLLVGLFFAAVNIGSLKVSFSELLRGLFVERIDNVATIWDLRFPRIIISMLAGAAIAVSGVLFQAVLKNPLADPGIIGISSGASFVAVLITAFAPTLFFFIPLFAFLGGVLAFFLVYSLSMERRIKSFADHPCRCGCQCHVYRFVQWIKFYERRQYVGRGIYR